MFTAQFTAATRTQSATVCTAYIRNGAYCDWSTPVPVSGKKEARKVAAALGATPWNF